jgi:hypothetical protein
MSGGHEQDARLADMLDGPWAERAAVAVKTLARPAGLLGARPALAARTADALRPHWLREVESEKEIELRDSLDFALAQLQLLELAVETGYLPLDGVRQPARELFESVLWSKPAQDFARAYDYVSVEYLARRVGFAPLAAKHDGPAPDPRAAVRYATFLDHHRHWLEDELIDEWLGFLDDYVEHRGEQDDFYAFLERPAKKSQRFARLAEGARRSIEMLSDLFGVMNETERPRYGLFYAYWLAKLFGYEYRRGAYRRNREMWDGNDSWARAIKDSPLYREGGGEVIKQQLASLETVWKETLAIAR